MIDELAAEFCMKLNSKGNRKKLVRQLFTVNRGRLDLLPFYSRLVATLNPLLSDIGAELVLLLVRDMKFKVKKKDTTIHILTKLKTVRFLAELTKFGVCRKPEAMRCLTILIQDFSPHSIEMACAMLEHCGRFLFRSPDSQPRTRVILEMLVRKKTALHLTGHQMGMIDNAIFYCNPPEATQVARVTRPPMEEFLRKLLFKDLNKLTTEKILKTIRKFPWEDHEVFQMCVQLLSSAWNLKFSNIQCLANILSGLAPLQEEAVVCVVDNVLEDIRLGLEVNTPRMNQRRVSMSKFLGELYNYQLVESNVIFQTLYSFLSFGWNPDGTPTPLDPPESYFRVRLITVLLDSCGHYFDHGSSKKKLDNFLLFFQCYLFKKRQPVPLEISNTVSDLLGSLRPKLTLFSSPQEAYQAALALEQQFKDKLGPVESENSETEMDEDDEMEDVESMKKPEEEEDESEEEGETDEDDTTSETQSEEEEEQFAVVSGPKLIPCTEDDELVSALEKMMSDSAQARRSENVHVPVMGAPVPLLKSKSSRPTDMETEEEFEGMSFTLLTKKGHKQQAKEIVIPSDNPIAKSLKDSQIVRQHERKEMKKIVLDFEQRQEEEEYQAMIASQEARTQYQRKTTKPEGQPSRGGRGGHQRGGARGRGRRNQHN
jgi:regulator of nonsense transcripts 2